MVTFVTLLRATVNSQPRGYAFDPRTGTEFRWHVDTTGNKHIATFNRTQRSLWNLTIYSLGNRSGTDENGDFQTFNPGSGVYRNEAQELFCVLNDANAVCLEP